MYIIEHISLTDLSRNEGKEGKRKISVSTLLIFWFLAKWRRKKRKNNIVESEVGIKKNKLCLK